MKKRLSSVYVLVTRDVRRSEAQAFLASSIRALATVCKIRHDVKHLPTHAFCSDLLRAGAFRAARAKTRGEDGRSRVGACGTGRGGVVRSRVRRGGARALRGRLAAGLARESAGGHTGPGLKAGRALRGAHGPVLRVVRSGLTSERDKRERRHGVPGRERRRVRLLWPVGDSQDVTFGTPHRPRQ